MNARPLSSRTRGIYGQAIKPDSEVDIPGIYCDKDGEEQFTLKLQNVDIIPESHYNVISLTRLMEEGHSITGNKKTGITASKGNQEIKFDIRVEIPKGVLWCTYFKRNDSENEVAMEASDVIGNSAPVKDVTEIKSILKLNIDQAHAILRHANEDTTRKTAAALNMQITRGLLKTCEPCAIVKAKQMNVNNESEGIKADKFNGRVYHDIAMVKETDDDVKLGRKSVWHVKIEETVLFKVSKFFVSKGEMPAYMCEYMESKKV